MTHHHVIPTDFERRRADWRIGPVVYQAIVDRFAPSDDLDARQHLYAPPRRLLDWNEKPCRGQRLENEKNVEGELQFYGGTLRSMTSRLDYLRELGVECLYLNPIFEAFTNHKYDAMDYRKIDPQYGTMDDLRDLAAALHGSEMRLMLDGVFNHMGRRSPFFLKAMSDPASAEARTFVLQPGQTPPYRAWRNVLNLPETNLEDPDVRRDLIEGPDSVVAMYLRDVPIDGWRLDVAPDLGPEYLRLLTLTAHSTRADAAVIGECWNYPKLWLDVMDGILNMHVRELLLAWNDGRLAGGRLGLILQDMIDECGIEGILRSHLVLDNHDTARIATVVPDEAARRVLFVLQFTLPGAPVIYCGSELGLPGGHDPECRAAMPWDANTPDNATLQLVRALIAHRSENPALRYGDFRTLRSESVLAFLRTTDASLESVLVVANLSTEPVREFLALTESRLMDASPLECVLSGDRVVLHSGTLDISLEPHTVRVFRTADRGDNPGYSMYKRMP